MQGLNAEAEQHAAGNTLSELSDEVREISLQIERAWTMAANLSGDYFGYNLQEVRAHSWRLLNEYDNARVLADIASDYLYQAKERIEKLQEHIDETWRLYR